MSNGATTVAAPQSVADVEKLVQRLYQPGTPDLQVIRQINDQLQALQHSQHGWQLADELLASQDANVRFFGALTFQVKLNNDWHALGAQAPAVLARLIYWLVRLTEQQDSSLVCKKLCSALTTYFIQSPVPWERPLYHLALCFQRGPIVIESDLRNAEPPFHILIRSLKAAQMTVLLSFTSTIAEEMGKVDANAPRHARLHTEMEDMVADASELIYLFLQQNGELPGEALLAFLAWVNYAQPIWPRNPTALQHLRNLIVPAAGCLSKRQTSADALDIFRDILESYTSFFQPQHMAMLALIISEHINGPLERALTDRDSDGLHVSYGQFVIAFGCANIQQIVEEPNNTLGSRNIVDLHIKMISTDGHPGDDDQLSIQSIEFWNTYIEYVNDEVGSTDGLEAAWLPSTRSTLQKAFQALWRKMITPPREVADDWGEEEREGFKEFRLDTTDLLLSIYVFLEKEMLRQLVQLTLQALEATEWRAVEASLFCLSKMADNILEDPANEPELEKIFRTDLFRQIANFEQTDLPPQTRRTAIDLLGSYGPYIERHAEFLPDTLNFLFASLEQTGLAEAAARSIETLCSTCRASLTGELPGFLAQYQRFLDSNSSHPYTKEKVIGAIAAIIQAKTPESSKAEPLIALIQQVEKDVAAARQYAAAGEEEMVELVGVNALACLASIGKGLQVPDDVPIDIYEDGEEPSAKSSYWQSDEGQAIQQRIMGCFSVLQVVGSYSAAVDAACQVLRSGYTETEPGPFVLPPSITVSFIQHCAVNTPQLEMVLATAGMLITQHSRPTSDRIYVEVKAIHGAVVGFTRILHKPSNDPGVAAACIDVLARLMPYYTEFLLQDQNGTTFDFILAAIIGPDSMPKKSACEFWTKLITPPTAPLSAETQAQLATAIQAHGSKLAACVVVDIGGNSRRSDLDFSCEPLRALLLHEGRTQLWLQEALMGAVFPKQSIAVEERMRFLKQLMTARGDGRKIKEVVRGFWALCRGTVVSYGS